MEMFSSRLGLPSAWLIFALPHLQSKVSASHWVTDFADLTVPVAIGLELKVLLSLPDADWSFLLKVLLMRNAHLTALILHHLIKRLPAADRFPDVSKQSFLCSDEARQKCRGFLCRSECLNLSQAVAFETGATSNNFK